MPASKAKQDEKPKTDKQQADMVRKAESPGPRDSGTTARNQEQRQHEPPQDTMRPLSVPEHPEEERSHLIDPRTSMSSGDPPAALTPTGERLGSRIGDPELEKHKGHSEPTRGPEGPTKATMREMPNVRADTGSDPEEDEQQERARKH